VFAPATQNDNYKVASTANAAKKRGDKIRNWGSLFSFLLPWKSIYVFLPPDYCEFVQLAFVVKVK